MDEQNEEGCYNFFKKISMRDTMIVGQALPSPCGHTAIGHVFQHALCSHQTVFKRATAVAFASLLLIAAVFAAYSIVSKYVSKPLFTRKIDQNIIGQLNSTDPGAYPPIGQLALLEANELLQENSNILPYKFTSSKAQTFQTINTPIPYLMNLFEQKYWPAFLNSLVQGHNNVSPRYSEILGKEGAQLFGRNVADDETAFKCLKIAYVISCLTLEDLKPFTERLKGKKDERTPLQALIKQDSYQFRTILLCAKVYHMIRGGLIWNGTNFVFSTKFPKSFTESFYCGASNRKEWNELYNDYCKRIALHVDKNELGINDIRFVNWPQEDRGGQDFTPLYQFSKALVD